jgi:hypothetical protein
MGGGYGAQIFFHKSCSPYQQSVLLKATRECCDCITRAADVLENNWDELSAAGGWWAQTDEGPVWAWSPTFTFISNNYYLYLERLKKVRDACKSRCTTIKYWCVTDDKPESNAYVNFYFGFPGPFINIRPAFFNNQNLSKPTVICHEFGRYFLSISSLQDENAGNTNDIQMWEQVVDYLCQQSKGIELKK